MTRIIFPWTGLVWLLLTAGNVFAQDCDCDGSGDCPGAFGPNFNGQVCYEITDALNNDLADPGQGICGVAITFTHSHIWDLELTLVSPSGQEVPLVGQSTNFFGTTNNVLWDIVFIPCAFPPDPDTINGNVFSGVWTNNQSWPFAGIFNGTYLPVGGNCLESFNTGPVNGEWCLQIDNQPSPYSGEILNFEILLCDNSGLLCCDADAGEFDGPSALEICQGDTSLLLDLAPDYGPIEPSPLEYGYLYAVANDTGLILEYLDIPDLTAYQPGEYTVCGLSYLLSDSLVLPVSADAWTLQTLQDNLNGPSPVFCGDLGSDCLAVTIVAPPPLTQLVETICAGDTLFVLDSALTVSGGYTLSALTPAACDTIVQVDLTVLPDVFTNLNVTICAGAAYQVGDSLYQTSGIYQTQILSQAGCDSLVTLDLTVLDSIQTFLTDTICVGETYQVGGQTFSASGIYEVPLVSWLNCDSLVTLDLTVLNLQAVVQTPAPISCTEITSVLDGVSSSSGPDINYLWTTPDGVLLGPTDNNTALAGAPGTYFLEVSQAGCFNQSQVVVQADTAAPVAIVSVSGPLTCVNASALLDGSGSQAGINVLPSWAGPPGGLSGAADQFTVQAQLSGQYQFVLTDTSNGCSDMAQVEVVSDTIPPLALAGPDGVLTCLSPDLVLDGSGSFLPGLSFTWTDSDGTILPWQGNVEVTVSQTGYYVLEVLNPLNGCSATDTAVVSADFQFLAVDAGQPDTLTCLVDEVEIGGSLSAQGPGIAYSWMVLSGNISGPPDELFTMADQPGEYVLTVLNQTNGCAASDTVQVAANIQIPAADAGLSITLNCALTQWTLGDPFNTASGPDIAYTWTDAAGNLLSSQFAHTVQSGGWYFLSVLDQNTGCIGTDSVFIGQNQIVPVADAGQGGDLDCGQNSVLLDGSGSSAGVFIQYAWFDGAGNLITDEIQWATGQGGDFCLVVTDGLNLCSDTACVTVFQDTVLPLVDAGPVQSLSCLDGIASWSGSVTPANPGFVSTWTTPDGQILTDPGSLTIQADEPGTYFLEIQDTINGCISFDFTSVFLDTAACTPQVNAGADGVINCYSFPFDTLDASAGTSLGPQFVYQWTTPDGSLIQGEETLFPVVTEGTYILTVTNTVVGLSASDTALVAEDFNLPVAHAGPDVLLDCLTLFNAVELDGTNSSQGGQYQYQWSTISGFISAGANSLMPTINAPGVYDLEVIDLTNGCSATDAILVNLDGEPPTPCFMDIVQIPCGDTLALIGDTCSAGQPYTYQWIGSGGFFVGSSSDALVSVFLTDSVGQFQVLVADTTNFCTAGGSITVFAPSSCFPDCQIEQPDTLTCQTLSVTLNALGSSQGPAFVYSWTALSGNLCGGENTLTPCVNQPGIYELTVSDTSTNFVCSAEVEVPADTLSPQVNAGPSGSLTCSQLAVPLQGSSLHPDAAYLWTGPCVTGNPNALLSEAGCGGWYFLEITDTQNGCQAVDSVEIVYDTIAPLAVLAIPDTITCAQPAVSLLGQGSAIGSGFLYTWTRDGLVFLIENTLTIPTASVPGVYCLEVLNQNNGCSQIACVQVVDSDEIPDVEAGPDQTLTCQDTLAILSGSAPPPGAYSFLWLGPSGCIVVDPAQSAIQVSCPGAYTLFATDLATGCTGSDLVEVLLDTIPPLADAGQDGSLDCSTPQTGLDGSGSQPAGLLDFQWMALSGNIVGPSDQAQIQVNAPGVYVLEVIRQDNGCTAMDTAQVLASTLPPIAQAGADTVLTCSQPEIFLNGSGSTLGNEVIYQWTGPVVVSGGQGLTPLVAGPGWYLLQVTDTTNQCAAVDSVWVGLDAALPVSTIELSDTLLTCQVSSISLSGTGSIPTDSLFFQWITFNGQIQGGLNEAAVMATAPGTYFLVVENIRNGCRDTSSVFLSENIQAPQIVFAPPGQLDCGVDTVILDASGSAGSGGGLLVLWQGPPGAPIGHPDSLVTAVTDTGVFMLTITDLANGCTAVDSLQVEGDFTPPVAIAQALDNFDCETERIGLSGEGSSQGPGFVYQWISLGAGQVFDASFLNPEVDGPGEYLLVVTNLGNSCSDSATVIAVADAAPILGLFLTVQPPDCFGDQNASIAVDSVIGGEGPFLFAWNGGGYNYYPAFNYLFAGEYSLQALDENGCTFDTLVQIWEPQELDVNLGPDQYIQLGETAEVEAILNIDQSQVDQIQWFPEGDPDCPECLEFELTPAWTLHYEIVVTDTNGCQARDDLDIFVRKSEPVFVANIFSPNGDGKNDVFLVQGGPEVERVESFRIFDRWGNMVFEALEFLPNDPAYGWDGNFEGQRVNSHVFVWVTEISLTDGKRIVLKGDVTVVW